MSPERLGITKLTKGLNKNQMRHQYSNLILIHVRVFEHRTQTHD